MKNKLIAATAMLAVCSALSTATIFAGQEAQRMLYTVPNNTFVENPSGENVVTVDDTSGSTATLQTLINNARGANPGSIIIIHLMNGATYWVNNSVGGLVLGSQECLVGSGATIEATNLFVTNALISISSGATNVSVAGGTLDANGANIYGIIAPSSSARINIDKVTVQNCGQDCIQLNGNGTGTFDNEMTVTRCDVSGSSGHSGISLWNATQAVCVDNNSHGNSVGVWLGNCAYCTVANNTCERNLIGIDFNSGNDNYIANNSCVNNDTGILASGSSTMVVSDLMASNTVAGINSSGSGNIYSDNLFGEGNATNFINAGSGDDIVAYQGILPGSGQNYFYPPLINNQHNQTIVNGMGRYDLTDNSTTTLDTIQSEYNSAVSAHEGDVIVLHLNGAYTVGANPLVLSSYTCILFGGTIQINSSTRANCAITATNQSYISISGGLIDGGSTTPPSKGRNAIYFTGDSMFQIDAMTLQHFGNNSERVGGSDIIRIDHGNTPRIITRCNINGGSARGIWLATSGVRDVVSDNTVTDVQMDGVDCDESTTASLVKFNYLYNNGRYGVFLEQSASCNCVLGNICNDDQSYDIGCYNNSTTYRSPTADNSIICNSLLGDNGLRNGSTGTNTVTTSDNFFFDNTVINADIQSQLYGAQNYYSQNYMGNSSLSTSGAEVFFNSPDVSGNLQVQDSNSGLDAIVQNAATTNEASVITGSATGFGNDEWQLIPTDSGYYRLVNENSGLAMVVLGASTNDGAKIIQYTYDASGNDEWMPVPAGNGLYSFVNRLSGLALDVTDASVTPGTQLDQQPSSGAANQQFNLIDTLPPVATFYSSNTASWTSGGAPDGNWSNPANWGGTVPQLGDWLTFGSGAQLLTTNNFSAGATFGAIAFNGTSQSFLLNGNGLVLSNSEEDVSGTNSGGTIVNTSVNNQTINLPVTLSAGNHVIATAGGAGQLTFNGILARNPGTLAQFSIGGEDIYASLANVNGIIGGWAVVSTTANLVNNAGGAGTVNWATGNSGAVTALSSYTDITGSAASVPNETGNNVNIISDGSSADTLSASGVTDMNTLYFSATADNLQLNIGSGQTLRLGSEGGILINSPRYSTIGNGSSGILTAGGGDNTAGELSLYNLSYYSGGGLVINATIKDNGVGYPVTVNMLGSVNLNYANSYSGGTYLNEGELYLQSGATLGSGPVYVFPGGRVDFGGNNGVTVTNDFYLEGYGFVAGNEPGALKGTYNGTFTGMITLMGDTVIDPNAGSGTNTCKFIGPITGTGSLTIGGASSSFVAGTAMFAGTNTYAGDAIIDATANENGGVGIKISNGANDIMQNGGNLLLIGGTSGVATFDLNGTTQTINGLVATNGTVTNAVVKSSTGDGTLIVGNDNGNSVFSGIIQNGGGMLALTKTGDGTLALTGNNSYTGSTTVNGGTLALSGSGSISNTVLITLAAAATLDASGLPAQTLTLNEGQTLQGSGTVNVNLAVVPGAVITPGDAVNMGALAVASSVQLEGTTLMKLNAASGTSDQINAGSIICGGTLTVTNLSGTMAAGQSFQLFSAGSFSGSFNAINLPPLGSGLAWSTNELAADGMLEVVSTTKPRLADIQLSGTNLIFSGVNGSPGQSCYLMASTNLALPFADWTVIATNVFDVSGDLNFTNAMNPNAPQDFYILQIP